MSKRKRSPSPYDHELSIAYKSANSSNKSSNNRPSGPTTFLDSPAHDSPQLPTFSALGDPRVQAKQKLKVVAGRSKKSRIKKKKETRNGRKKKGVKRRKSVGGKRRRKGKKTKKKGLLL